MTNDIPNPPATVPPPPPAEPPPMEPMRPSIFQIWMDALTKPYQATYRDISRLPTARSSTAFLWVFVASLVLTFCAALVANVMRNRFMEQFGFAQNLPAPGLGGRVFTLICGAPIAAVIAVVFFALLVGITHLVARAFGGRATFDQLAYAMAAIVVPANLLQAALRLLGGIPFVGLCFDLLGLLLGLYVLVLMIVAVMGVHDIGLGGAAVSVLVLPFVACICAFCAAIAAASVLAPTLQNILRNNGGGNPFPFPIPTP